MPVALATSFKLSSTCGIWRLPSADFTTTTGASSSSCLITGSARSVVATIRSGSREAMVSKLGSLRVPMSVGVLSSLPAVTQAL
ncbi:hypothetical protein D3C86_1994530 [compost metagenome]